MFKKLAFGSWYLAGAVISALLTETVIVKLKPGLTGKELGFLTLVTTFPWVIKPIWGLVIDKWGSMFWWAICTSVLVAASVLALPGVENVHYGTVLLIALVLPQILRSIQDVAVDGLSIAVSEESERPGIQGAMQIGSILGALLGGAGATYVLGDMRWELLCQRIVVIAFVLGVVIPAVCKKYLVKKTVVEEKVTWKDLKAMLKTPTIWLTILLAVLSHPAQALTQPVFYKWWSDDLHYNAKTISMIIFVASFLQVPAALLGQYLVKKCSKDKAITISVLLVVAAYAAVALSRDGWWSKSVVFGLSIGTGFADACYTVVLYTILMGRADPRFKAMSFALFMAGFNLCTALGGVVGGHLIDDHWSTQGIFGLGALFQIGILFPVIWRHENERHRKNGLM